MSALVRFLFKRDLLLHVEGELSPRAYTAPFIYDLKLPVARIAVAGGHGDVVEIHGVEPDEEYELESELLRLVPIPPDPIELPPPVPASPTSDSVVIAAAQSQEK
jgi:hypothetical protein